MTFLPTDYELPASPGQFLKLDEGDHKFRVLDSAITGWVYWTEDGGKRKPNRVKKGEDIQSSDVDPDNMPKIFWAFPVYSYDDNRIQTLELTQKTLMRAIMGYVKDEDYGDPQNYDLVVKRTGKALETEYSVIAKPPKPLNSAIIAEFGELQKSGKYDINRLYAGEYPMSKDDVSQKNKSTSEVIDRKLDTPTPNTTDEIDLDSIPL